jgi:hypothetical protein
MAKRAPFFIVGATAKIKVNDQTLAFCQDFSYSVVVAHATPHVLGQYESNSIEPLLYEVSGSFSVIRYTRNAVKNTIDSGAEPPDGVSNLGNGIGSWGANNFGNLGSDGRANENLDPSVLHVGTFFDIEVYQKVAGTVRGIAKLRNCRIEKADFAMAKTSPGTQRFTFRAIYADEDSFIAGFSGQGQQFG